jgi:hypothetical protein
MVMGTVLYGVNLNTGFYGRGCTGEMAQIFFPRMLMKIGDSIVSSLRIHAYVDRKTQ